MTPPLKSPVRSAAVGTNAERVMPRVSLLHSSEKKNCTLSLTIGPPIVPPVSWTLNGAFGWPACSRK